MLLYSCGNSKKFCLPLKTIMYLCLKNQKNFTFKSFTQSFHFATIKIILNPLGSQHVSELGTHQIFLMKKANWIMISL